MIQLWAFSSSNEWCMLGFYGTLIQAEMEWNSLWSKIGHYSRPRYVHVVMAARF